MNCLKGTELTNRIKDIVKRKYSYIWHFRRYRWYHYELPTFYTVNNYSQYDTYSIVKITKDLEIVEIVGKKVMNTYRTLQSLVLDSLYDLYIELTKGN